VRESTDDNNDVVEEETQPDNQSKDTEVQAVTEETNDAMEHEMIDEIDFGDGNGMDSLECTGPEIDRNKTDVTYWWMVKDAMAVHIQWEHLGR
jgi:hypothetical protein